MQKQTWAGHWDKLKAIVALRNYKGHVSLGVKCSKEIVTTMCGAWYLPSIDAGWQSYWRWRFTHPMPSLARWQAIAGAPHSYPTGTLALSGPSGPISCWGWLVWRRLHCHLRQLCLGHLLCHLQDLHLCHSHTSIETKFPRQEFTYLLVKFHGRVSMQRTWAPALATTCFYTRKIHWMH